MRRWVRSASLTNYAEVAREAGLDPLRMLREFGLPQSSLAESDLKLAIGGVRNLLEASAERSGVEAFGLLMAEKRRLAHLGPLGLLVREQPTMRHALEALARYANRLNQALFLTLEDAGDVVVLREELIVGDSGPIRQSTELAIGVVFCTLQALLGKAWKPRRVCFAHDAPADRSVHDRVFGRIAEFGHDFNGIVCARNDLEIPNPNADPVMARYAQDLVDASVAHRPGMADEVRETVVTLLAQGECTIEEAARRLGTNRRTIHRRLAQEGQTFRGILDDVRRELASRYVADHHRSLAEIAELLGFAAPSGFSRWYRRHFKQAASNRRPGRARKRLRGR
ncbi:MAG TPA: AraC family transcriptional regulator ligand-binding domain-containing protein [Usitatibacter sp.]|nr:AraC family transcriptional regulator ligand-binding domain-containing protein [Usitatibacter sp.]